MCGILSTPLSCNGLLKSRVENKFSLIKLMRKEFIYYNIMSYNARRTTDEELVKNMLLNSKPGEKKAKKNINSIMNRIIDYIKNKDRPCSLNELQQEIKELDLKSKEFLNVIPKFSEKLKFDERNDMLSLKSKYALANIEELKQKIRQSEHGLLEDEELKDSYPGIKNDIEKLKKENYVKVIHNTDKNCNVLYYRDTSDKFEQKLIHPDYQQAILELRKCWKDDLNFYDVTDKQQIFIKKRIRPDDNNRKGEKRRRVTRWANEHIYDMFNSKVK
jgi:hypothetical protein